MCLFVPPPQATLSLRAWCARARRRASRCSTSSAAPRAAPEPRTQSSRVWHVSLEGAHLSNSQAGALGACVLGAPAECVKHRVQLGAYHSRPRPPGLSCSKSPFSRVDCDSVDCFLDRLARRSVAARRSTTAWAPHSCETCRTTPRHSAAFTRSAAVRHRRPASAYSYLLESSKETEADTRLSTQSARRHSSRDLAPLRRVSLSRNRYVWTLVSSKVDAYFSRERACVEEDYEEEEEEEE